MSSTMRPTAVVIGVGAERGLGAALCRRFAAAGHHLLVAGHTGEKIERVVGTIRGAGGSAGPLVTDTTQEDQVVRLFDRAMAPGDGFAPADLIVFNAGNNQRIDFRELSAQQFAEFCASAASAAFLSDARRRHRRRQASDSLIQSCIVGRTDK